MPQISNGMKDFDMEVLGLLVFVRILTHDDTLNRKCRLNMTKLHQ